MKDWNIVVTIFQDGFCRALRSLRVLESIERPQGLRMKVNNPIYFSKASVDGWFDQCQYVAAVGSLFFFDAGKPRSGGPTVI